MGNDFANEHQRLLDEGKEDAVQRDEDRRPFVHLFHFLAGLHNAGVISRKQLTDFVSSDQRVFLSEVIEPLEQVLCPDYDRSTLDLFKNLTD
jgi:hypothetical protein